MEFRPSAKAELAGLGNQHALALLKLLGGIVGRQVQPEAVAPEHWPTLVELAQVQGLGPMLLWTLKRTHKGIALPDVFLPLVAERTKSSVWLMLATQLQGRIQQAFAQEGISCIWLKGYALAHLVYPAPELRPMADLDLLVRYEQRERALRIIELLGYHRTPQLFDGTEALKHHYHLHSDSGNPVLVELHFRLLGAVDRLLNLAQLQWFWEQTTAWAGPTGTILLLRPEAHLLYLSAHALLQHGEAQMRLLRLYDIHSLIVHSPELEWQRVVEQATYLGWIYALSRALVLTHQYFATPIPDSLLTQLAMQRPSQKQIAYVKRRQQQRSHFEAVVHELATMGWRDRVRAIKHILLPPPDYMRWRYSVDDTWCLLRAYWNRWCAMSASAWRTLYSRVVQQKTVRHG